MSSLKTLRHEVKYVIDRNTFNKIKEELKDILDVDGNLDGYNLRSLYFDSLDDIDYYEKQNGDSKRKKIRLRIYDKKHDIIKLELKAKDDIHQLKESLLISYSDSLEIINGNYEVLLNYDDIVATKIYSIMRENVYRPKTIIEYNRVAFVSKNNTRVTLDYDIKTTRYVDNVFFDENINYLDITNKDEIILEIKYDNMLENYISSILSKYISNRQSFSKYVMSRNKE